MQLCLYVNLIMPLDYTMMNDSSGPPLSFITIYIIILRILLEAYSLLYATYKAYLYLHTFQPD